MTGFNFGAMLSQNNQIKQIPLDMLVPFHNHQFSLYDGERRDDMVESIRKNGVMTPIVCRPNPDGTDTYEILIGHNRWNCSKIAGLETIPAIIKEQLTEEEAQTYVDESNLIQRGFNDLKVSEQARDLRVLSADGVLDGDEVMKVLSVKKKKPDKKVSIAPTLYKKYFAGLSNDEIADTVAAALDMFFKNKEKGICYICRILDKSEIFNYNDRILPIVIKEKGLKEISVILVTDKYRSIAEAEQHYPELLGGNNYDS